MATKIRYCWNCGESMGEIDRRYYDSRDTCGKPECLAAERDAYREEREEAHRDLDERMGY